MHCGVIMKLGLTNHSLLKRGYFIICYKRDFVLANDAEWFNFCIVRKTTAVLLD